MEISIDLPETAELKPRISVIGIGGAGCNAINNMIATGLEGVEFIAANTDAQALTMSSAEHRIQLGATLTEGLGAGAKPEIGRDAAEEAIDEIRAQIDGCHMVFLAAGMGGGTGTGAVSVIARIAREMNILTVAIVSKPFQFEGSRRMRTAEAGIELLHEAVDTLIVIPNQNLFRLANEKTTFAEAFVLADQVLYSGIACIVDLIVKDGLINLDFADVKAIMKGMGTAMMGTGEATGENRATRAAEEAISNPLLDEISLQGAKGLLVSIIGGKNLTLFEVDEAASRVKQEADHDANIIVGASFEDDMEERIRVSIVASGLPGSRASGARAFGGNKFEPSTRPPLPSDQSSLSPPSMAAKLAGVPLEEIGPAQNRQTSSTDVASLQTSAQPDGSGQNGVATGTQATTYTGPMLPHNDIPNSGTALADPYLGNTSVDEFARALSEVIGTVDDERDARDTQSNSEPADERSAHSSTWHSPDGVSIEDGFQPAMSSPPPPLPNTSGQSFQSGTGEFVPGPPAELPRRVPDISEFPEIVQREYQSKSGAEPAEPQHGSGVPGILRRLAGIGRQAVQLGDSNQNDSEHTQSSQAKAHDDSNVAPEDGNEPSDQRIDEAPSQTKLGW